MADKKKPAPAPKPAPRPAPKPAAKPAAAAEPDFVDDFGSVGDSDSADATTPSPMPTTTATVRRPATRADPSESPTPPKIIRPGVQPVTVIRRPIVSLDAHVRTLTKKQTASLSDWRGANHGKKVDAYFAGQLQAARQKFGHRAVMAGTPEENLIVGIPVPTLAFEYLIAQDCFPLGLVLQLVGFHGSLKSAMLYEFYRWFINAGGGGHLEEAETKWSPDLLRSITQQSRDQKRVLVDRCNSVEEWQQKLLYNIENDKVIMAGTKEAPGPGRTVPILFGVDSIMGKVSFETQEKVTDAGYAGRQFPLEALSITNFMKTVPQMIDGWPFALVLNNHLKMGKDDQGHEVRRTAGGVGVNFQESFELETKVRKSKLMCSEWEGVQISIKCAKNSFGPTHRQIDARMLWWEEPDPMHPDPQDPLHWRQKTVWDWHWATIKMLTSEHLGRAGSNLKKVFHIKATKVSDVENRAWSGTLGMKEKDSMPWDELGAEIQKHPEICNVIRGALAIKRRPLLEGDYLRQLEEMKEYLP